MTNPLECTVHEVAEMLRSDHPPALVDVREPQEWRICHLEQGQLLTEALLDEIVEEWSPDTPIVCYCHHGVRSLNAAAFLSQKGFTNVRSMAGGIDAWSREIDPAMPRY